ncbi:hypothetical protein V3C99_017181, partial [Haemonchus contortus]
GASRERHRSGG